MDQRSRDGALRACPWLLSSVPLGQKMCKLEAHFVGWMTLSAAVVSFKKVKKHFYLLLVS